MESPGVAPSKFSEKTMVSAGFAASVSVFSAGGPPLQRQSLLIQS